MRLPVIHVPLPFGFRLGHWLTGKHGLPLPLPFGFRLGHKITRRWR